VPGCYRKGGRIKRDLGGEGSPKRVVRSHWSKTRFMWFSNFGIESFKGSKILPQPVLVSFRDQTTGRIHDLLEDEGLACAQSQNLLSYFAGALLNYKEEGVEFLPSIILCDSIDEFLKTFPGSVSHQIGSAPFQPESGPQVLKDCAPLSGPNWYIFIERPNGDDILRYGIFTYFRLPTAIPLHEAVTIDPDQFSVLIRKASTNTIDVRGSKGSLLTLIFSTVREQVVSSEDISHFAERCCRGVGEDKIHEEFLRYFSRLLEASLTSCHGTILACGEEMNIADIEEMQDAVEVAPKIDFYEAFSQFKTGATAESILTLQRCEDLLNGFLKCDGIILFDVSGCISAYRVFFRPSKVEGEDAPKIVGGARRRAFEGLKGLLGENLDSVLFRSQDGQTIFCGEAA